MEYVWLENDQLWWDVLSRFTVFGGKITQSHFVWNGRNIIFSSQVWCGRVFGIWDDLSQQWHNWLLKAPQTWGCTSSSNATDGGQLLRCRQISFLFLWTCNVAMFPSALPLRTPPTSEPQFSPEWKHIISIWSKPSNQPSAYRLTIYRYANIVSLKYRYRIFLGNITRYLSNMHKHWKSLSMTKSDYLWSYF